MNAPIFWIGIPFAFAGIIWLIRRDHWAGSTAGVFALILAWASWQIPFDEPILFGPWAFKISSSMQIFGRTLQISQNEQPILALIYLMAAVWFLVSISSGVSRRISLYGYPITALLVAAIAVKPFLYAALLIQIAILLSVPLLQPPDEKPHRSVVRFLVYQTLAMPFILFSGWFLAGVEAGPSEIALVTQSALLLGLGFAFLLAVFPLSTWIPQLTEQAHPFSAGFVLTMFPTIAIIFSLGFIDRYGWLRESRQLIDILQLVGLLMVVSGGIWAALQHHLGRLYGYAVIIETGMAILALSLIQTIGLQLLFHMFIPRALALAIWAFALTIIKSKTGSLRYSAVQGLARLYPFAVGGLILAHLSLAGFPLLASYPTRLALWEGLSQQSLTISFWFTLGSLGLLISATRALAIFVMAPKDMPWVIGTTLPQRIVLFTGSLLLVLMGLFPQWVQPILINLPEAFQFLGR